MFLPNRLRPRTTTPARRARLGVQQLEARDNPSWLAQVGSSDGEITQMGHSRDAAGNSYLAGTFAGTVDFDPSAAVAARTAAAAANTFVAKYDPAGNLAWVRQFGFNAYSVTKVAFDAADAPYFYGGYTGTADFGGGAVYTATATGSQAGSDPFVLRMDPADGSTVWARAARTGGGYEVMTDVSVGADGCVYGTGRFAPTADFDLLNSYADNRDVLTAAGATTRGGNHDTYVWKLGADGGFRAAWPVGGAGTDSGQGIEVDVDAGGTGAVYLSGDFGLTGGTTTDLDPGPGTLTRTTAGSSDTFFARYALTGTTLAVQWGASVGGGGGEQGYDLSADDQYLYLAGEFYQPADFDPSAGQAILTPVGGTQDGVVAKYRKSDGGLVWAWPVGGPGEEAVQGPVVIDPVGGAVYVGGRYEQTIDFDPGVTHADGHDVQAARGEYDGFILKLDAATGGYRDAWRLGGTGAESVYVAAVTHTDAGPRVHVAGRFTSPTADFPVGQTLQNPDGKYDAYMMAFDEAVAPTALPVVSVTGGVVAEGNSGLVALTLTVSLSWASATPITLTYSTGGGTATAGTDYVAASGSVTFEPGQTVQTITVWVKGDTTIEADETFGLYLFDPAGIQLGVATGTITNDDAKGGKK